MAKISMRKAMILVMECVILAIFKAQANIVIPPSLYPTSLPIRLLQSSQPGSERRHYCIQSAFEKCKHMQERYGMGSCILPNYMFCIGGKNIPPQGRFRYFQRRRYYKKLSRALLKCATLYFKDQKVVNPSHAYCFVDCLDSLF